MDPPSPLAVDESSAPAVSPHPLVEVQPGRLIASVLLATFAADWLLFAARPPALGLALFALVCAAVILWNRNGWMEDRGLLWAAPVFLLAVAQATIDVSWINLVVLFLLLTFLAGSRFELSWSQRWPGWLENLLAWFKAPAQWTRANAILAAAKKERTKDTASDKLRRVTTIVLPGLILLVVFGMFLGAGNALAGSYLSRVWGGLADYLRTLTEIGPLRIIFWIFIATVALALCYPARCAGFRNSCVAEWRRFSLSNEHQVVLWQTWISLAALNGLYLFVNSLDVLYLWMQSELPEGVSYSSFVHEGVFALIASTVLAGVVISFFFQQSEEVARSKLAKVLAIAWIVQNLLLLSGVVVRLQLYVDAFGWSVLRFHVGSFLLLTGAGFILLSIYVIRTQTLRWLVLTNLIAMFGLIYLLQFANVNGWVSKWNVERWLANPETNLDVAYLEELAPPSWPALRLAADKGSGPEGPQVEDALQRAQAQAETVSQEQSWRSWQWRYTQWEKALRHSK